MTEIDLSRAYWRKSSYSGQSGNCVEVARYLPGLVAVRDSKEPDGARLVVPRETWLVFIRSVRAQQPIIALHPPEIERLRPAGLALGGLGFGFCDDAVPFANRKNLIGLDHLERFDLLRGRPFDFDQVDNLNLAETEVQPQVALRHHTVAAMHFIHLCALAAGNSYPRSDSGAIALGSH